MFKNGLGFFMAGSLLKTQNIENQAVETDLCRTASLFQMGQQYALASEREQKRNMEYCSVSTIKNSKYKVQESFCGHVMLSEYRFETRNRRERSSYLSSQYSEWRPLCSCFSIKCNFPSPRISKQSYQWRTVNDFRSTSQNEHDDIAERIKCFQARNIKSKHASNR